MKNLIRDRSELVKSGPTNKVSDVVDALKSVSTDGALNLCQAADACHMELKAYLDATIPYDEKRKMYGFEQVLSAMGIPQAATRDFPYAMDLTTGVFATYPGARSIFQPVLEGIARWSERVDQLESVEGMLAGSVTVPTGNQMISQVIGEDGEDFKFYMRPVAERAKIPVFNITASETSVRFFKLGMGIQTSYEFQNDVSIDMFTPYWNRAARFTQIGEVVAATNILINGDAVHSAAGVTTQSSLNISGTSNGTLHKLALLRWLVNRAVNGTPVDTLVGNHDTYFQLLQMFAKAENSGTEAENASKAGLSLNLATAGINLGTLNFQLSSTMPANKVLGFTKAETLQRLEVANSNLTQTQDLIRSQEVAIFMTKRCGFRLLFGDTRNILDYGS